MWTIIEMSLIVHGVASSVTPSACHGIPKHPGLLDASVTSAPA